MKTQATLGPDLLCLIRFVCDCQTKGEWQEEVMISGTMWRCMRCVMRMGHDDIFLHPTTFSPPSLPASSSCILSPPPPPPSKNAHLCTGQLCRRGWGLAFCCLMGKTFPPTKLPFLIPSYDVGFSPTPRLHCVKLGGLDPERCLVLSTTLMVTFALIVHQMQSKHKPVEKRWFVALSKVASVCSVNAVIKMLTFVITQVANDLPNGLVLRAWMGCWTSLWSMQSPVFRWCMYYH